MIVKKINSLFKRYCLQIDGNFSMMFSLLILVLVFSVGAVLDISSLSAKKAKVQNKVDAASLAVGRSMFIDGKSLAEGQALANSFLSELLEDGTSACGPIEVQDYSVTISCSGHVDTFLPGIVNKDKLAFNVSSESVAGLQQNYEVSFVFDISDSMNNRRIRALEDSLDILVSSQIFDFNTQNAVFSLIPFANSVSFDSSFDKWLHPIDGLSLTPEFSGCFNRETTAPSEPFTGADEEISAPARVGGGSGPVSCPPENMSARFFNSDRSSVTSMITGIETTFGTGTSDALTWGYRSLHPDMRGIIDSSSTFPRQFSDANKKTLILMTDGKPFNVPWTGRRPARSQMENDSIDKLIETCDFINSQDEPIDIFIVALGSFVNSSGRDLRGEFENCTQGSGYFVEADIHELADTIGRIVSEELEMRISQ